jgi:sec-independent protein translocase protein TatB
MGIENPVHLLFVALVALIVLGPRRLPELARALGKGVREFREALEHGSAAAAHERAPVEPPTAPVEPPTAPVESPAPPVQQAEPAAVASDAEAQLAASVDPARSLPSGDAPDRRSL